MAEFIISHVVSKLSSYLVTEAGFLSHLEEGVELLQVELGQMLRFLKDAEAKQRQNDKTVKNWIIDIVDIAYDVEDAIENLQIADRCASNALSKLVAKHEFGNKIRKIKVKIKEISSAAYGIFSPSGSGGKGRVFIGEDLQAGMRQSPYDVDNDSIVGLEQEKQEIVEQLLDPEDRLRVVSIVGMGGLGKTTLAKLVFNSSEVRDKFSLRAWVVVSASYTVADILKRMITEVVANPGQITEEGMSGRSKTVVREINTKESAEAFDEEELKFALAELLKSRGRFLIVLDDVWSTELWERIRTALIIARNGSRVILTTRSLEVARSAEPTISPHQLGSLTQDSSRALFLNLIYPDGNILQFPEDLKEVGQKIVEKCGGIPLVLRTVGKLLSYKQKNKDVWSNLLGTLFETFTEARVPHQVLTLSYDFLPDNLKPCFLYLASFPEGYYISARQVINLWVAECFTPPREGRIGRAQEFLEDLIQRSLVEVVERKYNGSVKTIRIHDLIRRLCIEIAEKNMFLNVGSTLGESSVASSNVGAKRRLAFYDYIHEGYLVAGKTRSLGSPSVKRKLRTPSLRTLLIFGSTKLQHPISQYFDGLKLLRVIDVEVSAENGGVRTSTLPKQIADMILLRYLRWIDHRSSVTLKASMVKLEYLQTFAVNAVINGIDKIGSLKKLRRLKHVIIGKHMDRELAKLGSLQKLEITIESDAAAKLLFKSLQKLQSLVSFSLTYNATGSIPLEVFTEFPALGTLILRGALPDQQQLPDSSSFPTTLTKITLESSRLGSDAIKVLESLPNLRVLRLERQSYREQSMSCSSGGFQQLRQLTLKHLDDLKEWTVETGAMCCLTHLIIHGCAELKSLPSDLQHMRPLQEIKLTSVPQLRSSICREWPKWETPHHVPAIKIIE